MFQKCSIFNVLSVFFREPTSVHFIREISKTIGLAPTSVRKHIKELIHDGMIIKKRAKPFDGFAANRENDDFLFYKRIYNLYSLRELIAFLASSYYPKAIILFGSYSRGEDTENSDIDIVVLTKAPKEVNMKSFDAQLKRTIHILPLPSLDKLDDTIRKKVLNGILLHGGI